MKTTKLGTPFIHIPNAVYEKISLQISDEIDGSGYHSGSYDYDNGSFVGTFKIRMTTFNSKIEMPEGTQVKIDDILPIWWSFETYWSDDGEMVPNDFDFKKLKDCVLFK